MAFLNRVFAAIGLRKSTGKVLLEGNRVVMRDLQRAKTFPLEPGEPGRKEIEACKKCGGPLRTVVFTTAGSGKQVEIWRQYPLAVDGWMCPSCGWSALPRLISAKESVDFAREGSAHASNRQFDDAEFWFRRIVASWPGYAAGYADMGQLALARADASRNLEAKTRHRLEAANWFRRAVEADPECTIPGIRLPYARALALIDSEREALVALDGIIANPAHAVEARHEAEALSSDIRDGRGLFTRATEMIGDLVLEPPSKPLTAADRSTLEQGRTLLKQVALRKETFATSFFLGKIALRLGDLDAALTALQHAHEIEPEQPDGCRELGAVYLELARAHDALPIAQRAVELRPDDAGLRCNLALVLLLTGNVADARSEAATALSKDPGDTITQGLIKLIDDVTTGRRQRPRSLAEAEGRKR